MWRPGPGSNEPVVVVSKLGQSDRRSNGIITKLVNGKNDIEYRPVVFDAKKTRHVPVIVQGGSCGAAAMRGIVLAMHEYRLDPKLLLFDHVKRLGIEAVPVEARRTAEEAAAVLAFQQAREAGIELLPRPRVGAVRIHVEGKGRSNCSLRIAKR